MDGVQLLAKNSLSLIRIDQAALHRSATTNKTRYGLFLQREDTLVDGHTFYGHKSMKVGILCNVYFEPSTGFGLVMVTNGYHNGMTNHVGVLVRRMFTDAYEIFAESNDTKPAMV